MGDVISMIEKIKVLQKYYNQFLEWSNISFEEFKNNEMKKNAIERQIQLIIDTAISINNMLLKQLKKEITNDYFNSFISLAENDIIEYNFALEIAPSTGLRNVLIHQYEKIDNQKVYDSFKDVKKYYKEYINIISKYIENKSI